ncbi:MAG TPA: hypothetical protein VKC60_13020, partial [Opitutaceae bacterium]|nr:hypothetical protein [Opitutaceae bacterium]
MTNQEGAKAFTSARAAFAGYQTKATDESWAEWTKTRRTAATLIGRLSRQQRDTSLVADARQLVRDVSASGVFGAGIAPEDEAAGHDIDPKNWPALLAKMLLAP